MDYTAMVDGGGSGTRLRLCDRSGRALAEASAGPSSLTFGIDPAWDSVSDALRSATSEAGLGAPDTLDLRIVAGFAGGRSKSNRDAFRDGDRFGCRDITIVTDGYASLIGALAGAPGVVLAVGTGVTVYALTPDGTVREASGWGFPAGDEGGGAWIGHRAIQAYLKHRDGRYRGESPLFRQLGTAMGETFDAIQVWLAAARATDYAALAPLVVTAAEAGDALSTAILAAAARELDETVAAVDDPAAAPPLAVLGGLGRIVAPRLAASLRARIVPSKGNALDGLQLLSTRAARWEDLE